MSSVSVPISLGELVDKITILEIKSEQIKIPEKLVNIRAELKLLQDRLAAAVQDITAINEQYDDLRKTNAALWNIEDEIRVCEKNKQFDEKFIRLARAVYVTNDRRFELKRQINELLGSELVEEKSYEAY